MLSLPFAHASASAEMLIPPAIWLLAISLRMRRISIHRSAEHSDSVEGTTRMTSGFRVARSKATLISMQCYKGHVFPANGWAAIRLPFL